MKLRTYVCFLLLWSSQVLAQNTSSSIPIKSPAFSTINGLNHVAPNSTHTIDNMPMIQSQDTVGSCFGCSSSTIVQKYICDSDKDFIEEKNGKINIKIPCNKPPLDKMVSQLSMVAWSDIKEIIIDEKKCASAPDKEKCVEDAKAEIANKINKKEPSSHRNIKLFNDTTSFSLGSNALQNALSSFKFMPESCFPFDRLVGKYGVGGDKNGVMFEAIYQKTRKFYETYQQKPEAGSQCEECLKAISADFNSNFTVDIVRSAFKKETFGEFLFELLFNSCEPISINSDKIPEFKRMPGKAQSMPKSEVFKNITSILDKKKPVQVEPVCLKYEGDKCISKHSLVVSGYRTVCPTDRNYTSADCKPQLLLHNCWGEDWQKQNNGGWVDAENLIKNINGASTDIASGNLSWLE